MTRMRWVIGAAAVAGVVVLVAPAVGQGKSVSLEWSRSPGGATVASYDFGAVADGSTVSRWFRLGSSWRQKSGALEIDVIGSLAFSITADRCSGKSIGEKLSCWVRIAYAPLGGSTSETARLRAGGLNGATATLRLSGSNAGGPFGHVYWADYDTVNAIPSGGGTSVTLASAPDALGPSSMATDGTHIYWVNDGRYPGSVEKVSLGGGNVTILATDQNGPDSVAVDGTHVYWTNEGDGTVNEVPIGGGTVTTLATGQDAPVSVAVDGTHVYWVDAAGTYPEFNKGTVNEVPIGGGAVTTLATGQDSPYAMAVEGTHVYWVNDGYPGGTVNEVPVGGGSVTTLATGQANPAAVAVDGTHVYWTNEGDWTVDEVPIGGGTVTTLATAQYFPGPLAVDGTHVYWVNYNGIVSEVPIGGGTVTTLTNCQLPDCVIQALAVGP